MRYGILSVDYSDATLKNLDDKDAKKDAIRLFNIPHSHEGQTFLGLWTADAGGIHEFAILPAQWQPALLQTAKDYPRFQILVRTR